VSLQRPLPRGPPEVNGAPGGPSHRLWADGVVRSPSCMPGECTPPPGQAAANQSPSLHAALRPACGFSQPFQPLVASPLGGRAFDASPSRRLYLP